MHPRHLRIEQYTYDLPDERIARYPLEQRDAARLLLYSGGIIREDIYRHLPEHIPSDAMLVFNQTKVVHARLHFQKPTGGVIEIFCLEPAVLDVQRAMLQKGASAWKCLVGGAAKWKPGVVPELSCPEHGFVVQAHVAERNGGTFVIDFRWDRLELSFAEVLQHAGKVPLPPYLQRDAEVEDENRYQTVFAKDEGSVAAPTAGLHFTKEILAGLAAKNVEQAFLTLHVGAGTFRPVKSDTMETHEMHAEWIDVTKDTIIRLMAGYGHKKIVAVGTTSLRTLESLYWIGAMLSLGEQVDFENIAVRQWDPYEHEQKVPLTTALAALLQYMDQTGRDRLITRTQILIAPGYSFQLIDGLITNFHQPQSTLLLLVAALVGEDWRRVYDYALTHGFRFLSYGDGSLLWRPG